MVEERNKKCKTQTRNFRVIGALTEVRAAYRGLEDRDTSGSSGEEG